MPSALNATALELAPVSTITKAILMKVVVQNAFSAPTVPLTKLASGINVKILALVSAEEMPTAL